MEQSRVMEQEKENLSDTFSNHYYTPGKYKEEARLFLKKCLDETTYRFVMSHEECRKRLYVVARIYLSENNWRKYIWIEQYGSLNNYDE